MPDDENEPAANAPPTRVPVLEGIRVADFSRVLAGPYATMMLADFGADVIKVEASEGDETRSWKPPVDRAGGSTYFGAVNRNKRSVVCDLQRSDGLARARELAMTADVVIENFRPGVMERFGLDEDSVRAANPAVVYCSITGFGRASGSDLPGYDLLVQAVGGLMSITGAAEGPPVKVGVALVDVLTGLNAVSGILLALHERSATGIGQRVDIDLMSTLLSALTNQAASTLATGASPARLGNAHPSIAPYELFQARDRELVIAVGNDRQFAALAAAIGQPQLAADGRFLTNQNRVGEREALREAIDEALAVDDAAVWVMRLNHAGVPAGLVNTIAEAFEFARMTGISAAVEVGDGERLSRQVANPIHLSRQPAAYLSPPPMLSEHRSAEWLPRTARSAARCARSARDEGDVNRWMM